MGKSGISRRRRRAADAKLYWDWTVGPPPPSAYACPSFPSPTPCPTLSRFLPGQLPAAQITTVLAVIINSFCLILVAFEMWDFLDCVVKHFGSSSFVIVLLLLCALLIHVMYVIVLDFRC